MKTRNKTTICGAAVCATITMGSAFAQMMSMPPPMWESGPADSPVDTRIYIVSNIRKTIAANGWEVGQAVQVMDAPMRVQAAISPAKIVYTNPNTGESLGTSTYIGLSLFGFNRYREYETDNGYVDLVGLDASIRRVKQVEDGFGEKDFRKGMYYYCQEITEERKSGRGVGLHAGAMPRRLWEGSDAESPFPGKSGGSGSSSPGSGRGGASSMFPAGQGGNAGGQTPDAVSQQQKAMILSDIDLQITQLETRLQQLRMDLLDAENDLDSAMVTETGTVMASTRVMQLKGEISNTQMRLNFLRQQRTALATQR